MPNRFLHWSPRILSVAFVAFTSLFSLDVFNEYQGWVIVPALAAHLVIPLVVLVAVVVAWKWDVVGAALFFGFALYYVWMVGLNRDWTWYVSISGPAAVIGVLFLLSWFRREKTR